jgi:hypothetical protein
MPYRHKNVLFIKLRYEFWYLDGLLVREMIAPMLWLKGMSLTAVELSVCKQANVMLTVSWLDMISLKME